MNILATAQGPDRCSCAVDAAESPRRGRQPPGATPRPLESFLCPCPRSAGFGTPGIISIFIPPCPHPAFSPLDLPFLRPASLFLACGTAGAVRALVLPPLAFALCYLRLAVICMLHFWHFSFKLSLAVSRCFMCDKFVTPAIYYFLLIS